MFRRDADRPPDAALPRPWGWLVRRFQGYTRRYVRRHFHAVRLSKRGHPIPAGDDPLLVVLNHPSWWDPLIGVVLSGLLPGRKHFAAMDAAAVRQYPLFRKLGFVPVDPTTLRGAAEFLLAGRAVLSRPGRVFWVTAQGRFADARERPLGLKSGVGHLAAALGRGTVLPIALEYTFWTERTPEALVHVGAPLRVGDRPGLDGRAWAAVIEVELTRTLNALAAEAVARNPGHFTTLVEGRTGVGGVYELWRRAAAWARGRRFESSHAAALAATRAEGRP